MSSLYQGIYCIEWIIGSPISLFFSFFSSGYAFPYSTDFNTDNVTIPSTVFKCSGIARRHISNLYLFITCISSFLTSFILEILWADSSSSYQSVCIFSVKCQKSQREKGNKAAKILVSSSSILVSISGRENFVSAYPTDGSQFLQPALWSGICEIPHL